MNADELVERSGASVEYVRTLIELGIASGGGDDQTFSASDIQRVRLVRELEQSGIAIEAIGEAVASGHLSLGFVDAIYPNSRPVGAKTLREISAALDFPLQAIARLYAMWGLAQPDLDEAIREDEAAVFSRLAALRFDAFPYDVFMHAARPVGEMAHRIADLAFDFFRARTEAPMLASGMSPKQIMDSTGALVEPATAALQLEVAWLVDRRVEHHTTQLVIEYLQAAIDAAGGPMTRAAAPPRAIIFLDLAGFTALTEELGDEAAAEQATMLGDIVQEVAQAAGGQVVKLLGDGAMFYFADPGAAALAGLNLVERVDASGLPPARVAIAAGPVVFRDADCFGRTVNLAARVMDTALPRQVLATQEVVRATDQEAVRFEDVGEVTLKGVSAPVMLAVAFRRIPAITRGP